MLALAACRSVTSAFCVDSAVMRALAAFKSLTSALSAASWVILALVAFRSVTSAFSADSRVILALAAFRSVTSAFSASSVWTLVCNAVTCPAVWLWATDTAATLDDTFRSAPFTEPATLADVSVPLFPLVRRVARQPPSMVSSSTWAGNR